MTALEELNRTILLSRDYIIAGLSDEDICECFQSLRVHCVSDLRNVSSHSGQTALVTLTSLLSRMGMQVGLSIPEVAILLPQPPLSGRYLLETLIASSEIFVTGATTRSDPVSNPDLIFVLGDTKYRSGHAPCWRMSGNDWFGALAMEGELDTGAWTSEWPVGSMVSASLAAGEAFKFVMRRLPLREEGAKIFFEASRSCNWNFESVTIPEEGVHLGQVDVISAGAICQASLYALLRFPRVQMSGRILDDDSTVESNLNRNMLTLITDIDSLKAHVVAQRCGLKLRLEPMRNRFEGDSLEIGRLAPRVLVGVDDIPSRWAVQRHAPGWLAVGGTSHFNVSSSAHSPGEPCSGCLHPVDEVAGANPIPTVSFVSFWAGLAMAVRLFREAVARPYDKGKQQLWLTPLRMDQSNAGMWFPVAPHRDCPVQCLASRAL